MATVTVTDYRRGNHGRYKIVNGNFTEVDSDMEIYTGLKRIIWFWIRAIDAGDADNEADTYFNSKTASDIEDDGGWVHIPDDELTAGAEYAFEAIGV